MTTPIVDTKAAERVEDMMRSLILHDGIFNRIQIATSFDCSGTGDSVAIREGARRNNYMHLSVDLAKCTALMDQKDKCIDLIKRLEREQVSRERARTCADLVPMLAEVLKEGVIGLLMDCQAAIEAKRFDPTSSRAVYDLVDPSEVQEPHSLVTRACVLLQRAIGLAATDFGQTGVVIQFLNSHMIFPKDCMPEYERYSYDYAAVPERIGVLMLRALVYNLQCCIGRSPRIIWAFTGTRKTASYSFRGFLQFSPIELSESLEYFDVTAVKECVSGSLSLRTRGHSKLAAHWERLVGPPIVASCFLDAVAAHFGDKTRAIEPEALLKRWTQTETAVVSMLCKKYGASMCDTEVAKFCCIAAMFSFAGQLDAAMHTLHSSVWALTDSGLLRMRLNPTAERSCAVYFDRPYPLLVSLFVEKCGIPVYALGPLARAMNALTRNSPVTFRSIAEVTFAFELHRMFEAGSGACLRTSLGLKRFFSDDFSFNPKTGSPSRVSLVPSVNKVQFGDDRGLFVVYNRFSDAKSDVGFRLALEAETLDEELVRLLICVSLSENDRTVAEQELLSMAVSAASGWNEDEVRSFCVYLGPYSESNLRSPEGLLGSIIRSLPLCEDCRGSSPRATRGRKCTNVCSSNTLPEQVIYLQDGARSAEGNKAAPTVGVKKPLNLFYFGRDYEFWNSSLLNQFIRDRDRTALTAYLLGLVNLQHVSEQFRSPSDKDRLIVLDMERVNMNHIGLYRAERVTGVPSFPADVTDLTTCMSVYFNGQLSQVMASIWVHGITGLSLLDAKLLSDSLQLGLSADEVTKLDEFAGQYCLYRQSHGLPDPRKVSCTAKSIASCLESWGTKKLDIVQIEEFLRECEKAGRLSEVTLEMMSGCHVLIGAKLAVLNILESIHPRAPTICSL